MKTSKAINILAENGVRIYPLKYYGSYKLVIETGEQPVGIRTGGTQRVGKKLYDKKEIHIAQRKLLITYAKKINNKKRDDE